MTGKDTEGHPAIWNALGMLTGRAVWDLGGLVRGEQEQTSGKAFLVCRRGSCGCKHMCVPTSYIMSSHSRKDDGVRNLSRVSNLRAWITFEGVHS